MNAHDPACARRAHRGIRRSARAVAIASLLALTCVALGRDAARAEERSRPSQSGTRVDHPSGSVDQYGTRVRFELVGSPRDRATGSPRTEAGDNLALGAEATWVLFAGDQTDPSLCNIGSMATPNPSEAIHLWQLHARVLTVTASATTLQLDWRRSRREAGDAPVVEERRVVTLEAGAVRVLDFIRDPDPTARCTSVLLQVRANPLPRPGPQPNLAYDVWLAYEGRGERESVHQTVVAPSGQPARFQLDGLAWSLDGRLQNPASAMPAVTLAASGTLVGTMGPDGSVAVSVRAVRSVGWGKTVLRGEGQIEFRSGLGETVALAVPAPPGRVGAPQADAVSPVAAGVLETARRTDVDSERFFSGTRISLYVRITQRGQ
jgi:hypothetical protein